MRDRSAVGGDCGTVTNVEAGGNTRKVDVAQLLLDAARQLSETLEPERVYERFHLLLADVVPHDGLVVGVVQLMRDGGRYTDDDFQLFQGLVGQMAAAVRNARLQRERSRLAAAEAAASARAAEREQAARVLDVVGDGIFLVDEDG